MQVQEKTQVDAFITFPSMIQNLEAKNDQFTYTKIFFFRIGKIIISKVMLQMTTWGKTTKVMSERIHLLNL